MRPRLYAAHSPAHYRARVAAIEAEAVICRSRTAARHEEKKKDERSEGQKGRSETALMTTEFSSPIFQHATVYINATLNEPV